jgi:hypothetical protein
VAEDEDDSGAQGGSKQIPFLYISPIAFRRLTLYDYHISSLSK